MARNGLFRTICLNEVRTNEHYPFMRYRDWDLDDHRLAGESPPQRR